MISIVIPAHNEGKYISKTLKHTQELFYPKQSYEVLVIENGSTDDTLAVAKKFENENTKVFSIETKGVSKAKNFGMSKVSDKSEWVIFLDADTVLENNFLEDLNTYLNKNKDKNFVIGTAKVKPLEETGWYANAWMKFYNLGHKYTKTSFSIQIMKASLKDKVVFDEGLSLTEDLKFIKDCLAYGKFLFLETETVHTSIRRFEKKGWLRLFLKWNLDALLSRFRDPKHVYPVVR